MTQLFDVEVGRRLIENNGTRKPERRRMAVFFLSSEIRKVKQN